MVSDKKIFKISANENTLWTLAAMLDFKSAPKHKSGRGPSSEHFWQVWLISVQRFQRRRFKCEKLTDRRTTDAYPWQKLTWPMARWAKKNNWSYVKTMSCSGSHLGITINIKNTKFVKDLPMIDAQFRFNQCNSFREEYISVFSPYGPVLILWPVVAAILDFRSA